MNYALVPFPVLTPDLEKRIGFSANEFIGYYLDGGVRKPLNVETEDFNGSSLSTLKITDDENQWHPESHNLSLERTVFIKSPSFLYGDNGIASADSELGIAFLWFSKDSNHRGVFDTKPIYLDQPNSPIKLSAKINSGLMKGSVFLRFVIYLRKKSEEKSIRFANIEGTILGVLEESRLIFDGRGSTFPIVEVEEPGQPLWRVESKWIDPSEDRFEDTITVCINRSHADYPSLNMGLGLKKSPLLKEILASAMTTIVLKVVASPDWDAIRSSENFEPGSIAQAVNYFARTFEWDTATPENLALTIRKDFDSRLGGTI